MPVPVLRVGTDDGVGHHGRESQFPGLGQYPVTMPSRPQLREEVLGAAQAVYAFEEVQVLGRENQPLPVGGELRREGEVGTPMDRADRPAERGPAVSVRGERQGLLAVGYQMSAEDGAQADCISGLLEFDCTVDSIGVGAGQMSRVVSSRIAGIKAEDAGLTVPGAVMASDAFFPFRDGLDAAAEAGISAVIQPGGSMRDDEVIAAADEHGIAMVFTSIRHFKH